MIFKRGYEFETISWQLVEGREGKRKRLINSRVEEEEEEEATPGHPSTASFAPFTRMG